jgi:translation initiation factor IF-3
MSSQSALDIAYDKGYDLVKISPNAVPPVCKIMDYGKFKFEQLKKVKEARKNQNVISIKEIQLTLKIDVHDIQTKASHALRFLKNGDKVKVKENLKGVTYSFVGEVPQGVSLEDSEGLITFTDATYNYSQVLYQATYKDIKSNLVVLTLLK